MASRNTFRGFDTVDSLPDSQVRYPIQSSEDTDVKQFYDSSKTSHEGIARMDSGFNSMSLSSPSVGDASLRSIRSSYDPSDAQNIYDMQHERRGHLVIINNRKFHRSTNQRERTGTDADAANLCIVFKKLGFEIDMRHNLTSCDMLSLVVDYAQRDHSKADCFALAVLTHGDVDGIVYGTDETIQLKKLVEPLQTCKSLNGKPKLLFIQACRGTEMDTGTDTTDAEVFTESERPPCKLPKTADFLYAYSTSPGYYSFRNSVKGSFFISALSKVFTEHGATLEVHHLLTRVNRMVACEFESMAAEASFSGKKQMPSFESMLTKELYFPPKH